MKRFFYLLISALLCFSISSPSFAEYYFVADGTSTCCTVTKTVIKYKKVTHKKKCPTKYVAKHKKRKIYRTYVNGCCKQSVCNGYTTNSCYQDVPYRCKTEYYYRNGRNSARVVVYQ